MHKIASELKHIKSIAIAGHVRPDGDCIGSCLGMYTYLTENYPDIETDVFLEEFSEIFHFLKNAEKVKHVSEDKVYDLFIGLDSSEKERYGFALDLFETAKKRICIDHHISNSKFADVNHIEPEASSTCELVYELLEEDKVSVETAKALYTGIAHDTGVFQYSNVSSKTLNIVGKLIDKGFDFSRIIDDTFQKKTYLQNQILGRALLESILLLDGKCIMSVVKKKDMEFYQVSSKDLDGIVNQLRVTEGVEVAIFLYEMENNDFKVSMRSNGLIDVSKIALYFGGGGHKKAAGCSMGGTMHDVVNNITYYIEKQLIENEQL